MIFDRLNRNDEDVRGGADSSRDGRVRVGEGERERICPCVDTGLAGGIRPSVVQVGGLRRQCTMHRGLRERTDEHQAGTGWGNARTDYRAERCIACSRASDYTAVDDAALW